MINKAGKRRMKNKIVGSVCSKKKKIVSHFILKLEQEACKVQGCTQKQTEAMSASDGDGDGDDVFRWRFKVLRCAINFVQVDVR